VKGRWKRRDSSTDVARDVSRAGVEKLGDGLVDHKGDARRGYHAHQIWRDALPRDGAGGLGFFWGGGW
jgi:hypothetical protein